MHRFLLPLALLTAALGGCTSQESSAERFKGEEAAVARVIEDLETAGARRDEAKICNEILAKALADELSAGDASCTTEIQNSLEDADDSAIDVVDVTVTDATATAKVEGKQGDADRPATIELVKEDGRWRVTSLATP